MDLKDKLDLIWKYSILVIILISLICFHSNLGKGYGHGYHGKGHYGQNVMGGVHKGLGYGKQIKIEKQIIEGDTTVVVWVNGQKIDDPAAFLAKHNCGPDMQCAELHGKQKLKSLREDAE